MELSIELLRLGLAVCRRSQRDAPIGMQMIHMGEGKKPVQRSVDGRRNGIIAECTKRIHLHHGVFCFLASVEVFEGQQLVKIESGETAPLNTPKVSAAALDPEYFYRLTRKRIELIDFGTCVAAGKVCDAQVRAEQI